MTAIGLCSADGILVAQSTRTKEVGDVDHLKVFATPELADEWFKENDPEGIAFRCEVLKARPGSSAGL